MFIFARAIFHLRFSVARSQGTRTAPSSLFSEGALRILDAYLTTSVKLRNRIA